MKPIIDVDGHEFAPPHLWGEIFGPVAARLAEICAPFIAAMGEDYIARPGQSADDAALTHENVWTMRHSGAPGAFDMRRRLEALDLMGIDRQLVFPSYGLWAQILATPEGGGPIAAGMRQFLGDISIAESRDLGFAGTDEWNAWAARTTALAPDRLRAVGMFKAPRDPGDLLEQAQELLHQGVRAWLINAGEPLAGLSPAHPDLDRFWAFAAANDVAVMAHVGSDLGLLTSSEWSNAPVFAPAKLSVELGFEPYSMASMHLAAEHFLMVAVLGGVFERHPGLRFGAIELGAHWLGPLADNLDMWADRVFARRLAGKLSMKPSAYLARNVRVTPLAEVDRVDGYFKRWPQLASCWCWSSDYPHVEGGRYTDVTAREMLASLGVETIDRYFHGNGAWLLPQ